ncbi:NAD(P)-dependent alcohol dehydrogenase [Roseomonas sp. BN140053]|uniref:NAD(P)-dependent alcohol dehydrogenase n=1 Tax=Roseomonas sp. BN140053 TaxID=3391898 RepID=UPI0039E978CE
MHIRAAVARDGNPALSLEDLELGPLRPNDVLVRIVATGVCHTDLKSASALSPVPRPVVLGHEGAGVVEQVGSAVRKLVPGDHVVLTFAFCGQCRSCQEAEPAYCYHQWPLNFGCRRPDGTTPLRAEAVENPGPVHGDFFGQSAFATHAIAEERNAIKVRRDAPLELLGPLGCGIQTGAGAVLNDFALRPGQSLAVFGTGSLGLSAIMAARLSGASRIIAVDRHRHRLELARELGADEAIDVNDTPATAEIMRLTGEGVDFALDTTGVLPVMREAIDVLAPRGTCGFVTGPWDRRELPVPVHQLLLGRKIRGIVEGNSNPDLFIPRLVDFFLQGRFPFDRLVSFYPFDAINQAFHDVEAGTAIKPILRMP